jgi:hypothetical protein
LDFGAQIGAQKKMPTRLSSLVAAKQKDAGMQIANQSGRG